MTIIQSLEQIKTGADVSSDNIADLFFKKKDKFRNVINYEQPNAKSIKNLVTNSIQFNASTPTCSLDFYSEVKHKINYS